jgi:hypothetical protein
MSVWASSEGILMGKIFKIKKPNKINKKLMFRNEIAQKVIF